MSVYADMYKNVDYPVICTRGVIIFPDQDIVIDVGRPLSVNALEKARSDYNSLIFLVTQKDIMVEEPTVSDMYSFGTLCSIKHVRQDKNVITVKFHGLARAQANVMMRNKDMFMANISVVDDIVGDNKEELVLVKRLLQEFENISSQIPGVPRDFMSQATVGMTANKVADQFGQFIPMS